MWIEVIKAFILGIIQGMTEWLPISSTGHILLFCDLFPLNVSDEFFSLFSVIIQIGSILAVIVIYFGRLNPFTKSQNDRRNATHIWGMVILASLPVFFIGAVADDIIDGLIDGNSSVVVSATLIVYGVAFIISEIVRKNRSDTVLSTSDITPKKALLIGLFESLALIPGTSRSGATILGGRLLGLSRETATEYSFFLAIPAMFGAGALKLVKFAAEGYTVTYTEICVLAVGLVTSFVISLAVIKLFTGFIKRRTFISFGIYRIILGMIILIWKLAE